MSEKFRRLVKDILLVTSLFATLSGAYYGFAVAERYRALTKAYLVQAERIMEILRRQTPRTEEDGGS